MATLKELAELVHGDLDGDPDIEITGVAEIQTASSGTITFLSSPKYRKYLSTTQASAVVVSKSEVLQDMNAIYVDNPILSFSAIMDYFSPPALVEPGIHSTAVVADDVDMGENVTISPYVVVEDDVVLGDDVVVGAYSFVGQKSKIGNRSVLKAHVIVYPNCVIGKDVLIHSGTVIGTDGYGFVTHKGVHHKVPQIGRVVIGNNVEIGANCAIDRGAIGDTVIGEGSKLDNMVHIAHNVKLGKGCLVTAQVAIAGSSIIGDYVAFGGQSGVTDHVEVGNHVQLAAKTGVTKSLPGNKTYAGMPAREIHKKNKSDALLNRLPDFQKKIRELEEEVKRLKEKN